MIDYGVTGLFLTGSFAVDILLGMGEHQAAWYWTRKLIADTLAARQTLSRTEFAAAMIQNLRYAGAIAAFLDGPHATTLRTRLSMESEVPTLLANIPQEYQASFDAGARKVSARHAEFLRTQERRLAEWARTVSEGKESGEIPQTTLTLDFEAGIDVRESESLNSIRIHFIAGSARRVAREVIFNAGNSAVEETPRMTVEHTIEYPSGNASKTSLQYSTAARVFSSIRSCSVMNRQTDCGSQDC